MRRSGSPGIIGSTGADRSSAWIWDFSSTQSTSARSGGSRYSPTTSRTLSMNCGSVDSLKVSTRCGLSPNARQIRPTVDFDSPLSAAIDARRPVRGVGGLALQGGHHDLLDLLVGDRARRARARLVDQPVQPARPRTGAATCPPSAATPRARRPPPCWIPLPRTPARSGTAAPAPAPTSARRAQRCSVSRSSSVNTTAVTGRPVSPPTKPTITQLIYGAGH